MYSYLLNSVILVVKHNKVHRSLYPLFDAEATVTTRLDKWLISLTKHLFVSKVVRLCVSNVEPIIALVNELWTLEMGGSASEELAPTFFLTQRKNI